MFAKEFIKVLEQYPDGTTFVDLFGGSGLLSHITKCQKPNSTVVYNDFDNYSQRLEAIPQTNALLSNLREIVTGIPRHKLIKGEQREKILSCIHDHERCYGYVDYITISSSLLFPMKYKLSLEEMCRETLYNNIRTTDYPLCPDYLDGLTIVSEDYKNIFERYKDVQDVVFLVDPPYLSTEVGIYKMYWRLSDYLDVLTVLSGYSFVYFTSDKSSILELCEWMGSNRTVGNPFKRCKKIVFNAHMNHNSSYMDIMLYKKAV